MVRWLQSAVALVGRLFMAPGLTLLSLPGPQQPEYPVDNAMSTLARFPWIWACEEAISSDLAGLPLVAHRKQGKKRVEVEDRALLLLEQPNAGSTGYLFRQQIVIDQDLTGNAYIWAPDGPDSTAIYRLHPRSVHPVPGPLGMPAGFEWTDAQTGETRVLPPEQVIHIRGPSWRDDAVAILGESRVRCLHDDLTADLGQRKTQAKEAARGRPDILFSSKVPFGDDKGRQLEDRWEASATKRRGAFFAGGEVQATVLSWSPKDREDVARATQTRDTILAVMGVPHARLGIQGGNYATDRQALKTYWTTLMGRARIFDDAFSRLAQPGVRIGHDFATQEALQISRTERQARMVQWIAMGWSPEDAAAIEGFEGLPPRTNEPALAQPAPSSSQDDDTGSDTDDEPNEPAERTLAARVRAALLLHVKCAESVYAELNEGVSTELFVRTEQERLFAALHLAGLQPQSARWWADEITGILDEAHRMGIAEAFAEERAARWAEHIVRNRRAA